MRAVVVTLGVLLSLAAAVFTAAAISLVVDGNGGAGGFAVFVALVCLLCAVLLFRASPRRAAPRQQRRPGGPGTGFYYVDSTPSYGWTAGSPVGDDRSWSGDAGADTGAGHHHGSGGSGGSGHHGHVDSGGWSGSDGGSSGGSGGSDGGSGGSDGGGGY